MEMDLIVDLFASEALTEPTLVTLFRKAGGQMATAVHNSTLDLQVMNQSVSHSVTDSLTQ